MRSLMVWPAALRRGENSHLRTGRSITGLARSPDGFHFTADPEPFVIPAREGPFAAYGRVRRQGVKDLRVTHKDAEYVVTYSAYSRNSVWIALPKTRDYVPPFPHCSWEGLLY